MNYFRLIGVALILIAIIGVFVAWFLWPRGTTLPVEQNPVTLPSSENSSSTASSTASGGIAVENALGETVTIRDFLRDPEIMPDPNNSGYFNIGRSATASSSDPYLITYLSDTQYFNIVLLEEPIGAARAAAEQYLLAHLGISQDALCNLKYMVSVPNNVNTLFSSRNLGFSFCPGATTLPQ